MTNELGHDANPPDENEDEYAEMRRQLAAKPKTSPSGATTQSVGTTQPVPVPGGTPTAPLAGYAEQATAPTAAPTVAPTTAPQAPQPVGITSDPFAAMGGGVQLANGDWVPRDHPAATAPAAAVSAGTPGAAATSNPTGAPTAATPSAPAVLPPNEVRGIVQSAYLQQAAQPRVPSASDPAVRAASDAFRANVDRTTRNSIADVAEAKGPYATGAVAGEARMARERGGTAAGAFEADLVLREITARRDEIQQALAALSGQMTEDERQRLTRELAQLNLQMEQQRLTQSGQQFGDTLGFNIADREAYWNDQALRRALGGA